MGHWWVTPKETAPSVDVKARLPVPGRWSCPSASCVPSHKEEYTEEEKGEYFEEEMKVDIIPPWSEPPRDSVTLYAYEGEDYGSAEYTILDTSPLYDRVNVELQDSRFGNAGVTEIDIKEHCINQTEDF